LRGATNVFASGRYPAAEAQRAAGRDLDIVQIPPGVDTQRFRPLDEAARRSAREKFGVAPHAPLVVGVSRLVPRKGFDVAIRAVAEVARRARVAGVRSSASLQKLGDISMLIGGTGRDRERLQKIIDETGAPVRLLGRVSNDDLPLLYGCADAFMMLCRNRWAGLEQEGFGIVFAEAAACAVPQIAGDSGGAAEAVVDGETGYVVADPHDVHAVADRLVALLEDDSARTAMAMASRSRAVREFDYSVLVSRLRESLHA
jgi:phosphatidylinositol alpha-1,6-mannosyltransferase